MLVFFLRETIAPSRDAEGHKPFLNFLHVDAVMGDDVRSRIRFIIAAAPASWSGQVSGTVHASYDGKRSLCSNKDLKHARVVAATVGFKPCAHSSGKCIRFLESSQSVSV